MRPLFFFLCGIGLSLQAHAMEVVPPGLLTTSPIISDATFARIAKKNDLSSKSFGPQDLQKLDKKFSTVVETLRKGGVFEKVAVISKKYGVSPQAVAACIIGEHVFNVHLVDNFQGYFIYAYSKWIEQYDTARDQYLALLKEKDIAALLQDKSLNDYERWDTIFNVYNTKYRGTKEYPNSNFLMAFFNPMRAGLTYGLGQLSPTRILLTNDIAVAKGGLKKIDPTHTDELYQSTLDVDTNIHYVAASVVAEIEQYKKHAQMDISQNIGVIATLYNLGDEKRRALKLAKENDTRTDQDKSLMYPKENFYGWYMNKKEAQIRALFPSS